MEEGLRVLDVEEEEDDDGVISAGMVKAKQMM